MFRVDAAGKTTYVSRSWDRGIGLSSEQRRQPLKARSREPRPPGILIGWPKSIPAHSSVKETFVFVITDEEVDLGFLETSTPQDYVFTKSRGTLIVFWRTITPYNVARVSYVLHAPKDDQVADEPQHLVSVAELSSPETTIEGDDLQSYLKETAVAAKGFLGGALRTLKGIPPYV